MIHKLANYLANLVARSDIYNDGLNTETYIYGFEVILGKIVTYLVLLPIGIAFNSFFEILSFIFFFMLLRGYTGGYHMRTSGCCLAGTIVVSLISIFIANSIKLESALRIFPLLLLMSFFFIWFFSPVSHPNLLLTKQEAKKCKKFARVFLLIELLVIIALIMARVNSTITISACLAIILSGVSIVVAKILKQEVPYYEGQNKCKQESSWNDCPFSS